VAYFTLLQFILKHRHRWVGKHSEPGLKKGGVLLLFGAATRFAVQAEVNFVGCLQLEEGL